MNDSFNNAKHKVAILQSNYIPWKGYFDIINLVDEFIIYDECQYSKGTWRNRNKIKTSRGLKWLTVPVEFHLRNRTPICSVPLSNHDWIENHLGSIKSAYAKAPYLRTLLPKIEALFERCKGAEFLSEVNLIFIKEIVDMLGIKTKLSSSMDYNIQSENATEKLLELLLKTNADCYLSGPAAIDYLDQNKFLSNNIKLVWMDYSGYPEYKQLHGSCIHEVTILDMLLNVGIENAMKYLLSDKYEYKKRLFL